MGFFWNSDIELQPSTYFWIFLFFCSNPGKHMVTLSVINLWATAGHHTDQQSHFCGGCHIVSVWVGGGTWTCRILWDTSGILQAGFVWTKKVPPMSQKMPTYTNSKGHQAAITKQKTSRRYSTTKQTWPKDDASGKSLAETCPPWQSLKKSGQHWDVGLHWWQPKRSTALFSFCHFLFFPTNLALHRNFCLMTMPLYQERL